jgi:lipid II:glycine glycyltransferase (peptidoglycan interpeptide bridge formation enzyme)
MEIKEVFDKKIWENFLLQCEEKTFLQSWNWGEFYQKMGNKIWRLGVYENGELTSVVLVVKIIAKRGKFLMVQHGPTLIQNSKFKIQNYNLKVKILETLFSELKRIGKEERVDFIRIAPLFERNEENKKLFQGLGFREAPMHANAYEATWKLDITSSEKNLLANMRKTTRYLIHQAEKNPEIEIIKSDKIEEIELYQELNKKVSKYQKFTPFSFDFVKNEFEVFAKDNQGLLFFGKYKEKIIFSSLIVFWSEIAFYHQAALDPTYHKIPIAYLSQWEAIKEAKKRGCKLYDFWGYVDPKKEPKHPWAGPTLFKMGFGGLSCEYIKTQDLPLSWKYWLTYFFEKIRKIKKGL